ncbi:hypothetical protein PoB_005057200 [Plakobranchus ocellatus]|uniref:Uncharacterized protein n=1 Tax=Plakobranchus ocellatus TaxID=259542 RepID=A0AAV4BY55_9GAST|nr:hypothetical protein PoB_005057200 [Plakobranchus ocellatus]
MAQRAKDEDKKRAAESNGRLKVITMDLQTVLLAPALKASALYYRTKLCVHNFTIFDCTTRDVSCYVWHEAEGGLTANEFASCLCHYLESDLSSEEFIIFSDGCPYQNRNTTLAKTYSPNTQQNYHTQVS